MQSSIKAEYHLIVEWLNPQRVGKLSSSERALFGFLRAVTLGDEQIAWLSSQFTRLWSRLVCEAKRRKRIAEGH